MKSNINSTKQPSEIPAVVIDLHEAVNKTMADKPMPERFFLHIATITKDGERGLERIGLDRLAPMARLLIQIAGGSGVHVQSALMAYAAAVAKVHEAEEVILFGEACISTVSNETDKVIKSEHDEVRNVVFTYQNVGGANISYRANIEDGKLGNLYPDESGAQTITGDRTVFDLAREAAELKGEVESEGAPKEDDPTPFNRGQQQFPGGVEDPSVN